jgi:hypothetical protein
MNLLTGSLSATSSHLVKKFINKPTTELYEKLNTLLLLNPYATQQQKFSTTP